VQSYFLGKAADVGTSDTVVLAGGVPSAAWATCRRVRATRALTTNKPTHLIFLAELILDSSVLRGESSAAES
jgi:hypothetical protein